jgi:sugar lactone lactonase YvrE
MKLPLAALFVVPLSLALAPSAFGYAEVVKTWGGTGSGDGQFHSPTGIAADSSGDVYVADTGNDRIQKFRPSGAFITEWGGPGTGDGRLSGPKDVAVAPSGRVYVADTGNDRIERFSSSGAFRGEWGAPGAGQGRFSSPSSVATDSSGNVYVADTGNDRIQKFTASGAFMTQWGGSGSGAGQFSSPAGVATDSSGNVYVADTDNNRIQRFSASGSFLDEWEVPGWAGGPTHLPTSLDVDSPGNVYVAGDSDWIEKFDSSGEPLFAMDLGFGHPAGVATDFPSRVYVSSAGSDRIHKLNDGVKVRLSSRRSNSSIVVEATAGTTDNLRITRRSRSTLRITDFPGGPYTGSGVNAGSRCSRSGPYAVDCPARGIDFLHARTLDLADRVANSTGIRSTLNGGKGSDILVGGSAADRLRSKSGADVLRGMGGDDALFALNRVSDPLINCDGRGVRARDDGALLDELPLDPDSVVKNCESVTRR